MPLLDDVLKEWNKFEFPLEPTKAGMKDLLTSVTASLAYSMAIEAFLISHFSELGKTTVHEDIIRWYEKFFAELSAKTFGKHGL